MSLTPQDLRDVGDASKREREHADTIAELRSVAMPGALPGARCYCDGCRADRETIAKHTPEIMRLLRDYMRTQARGDACGGMG
jgi:hypothetical protein